MPERIHVHVPWRRLEESLPFLLARGLAPEIAFKGPDLDRLQPARLREVGRQLAVAGLDITIHAPFADLNPGAMEPLVQEATRKRFLQTMEAAARLGARLIVFHPGYDRWKYAGNDHLWLEQNLRFWPSFIDRAQEEGCVLALENIFEENPSTLASLLAELDSPHFGHCFDVGHWHLFADGTLDEWFAALGSRLVHLHLHDNLGQRDDHLPVGEGDIDFTALFRQIRDLAAAPSMTLEAHSPRHLLRSLAAVAPLLTA